MRAKMDPKSTPQVMVLVGMLIGEPLVFDVPTLEFEEPEPDPEALLVALVTFAPLLTGEREDLKSAVGSFDTLVHDPPDVVELGS